MKNHQSAPNITREGSGFFFMDERSAQSAKIPTEIIPMIIPGKK